jgi:trimeric autotransporter adhesin
MNTKQIFAAIGVATVLTVITPAYAHGLGGGLGGGFGGALSGSTSGMSRLGGVSGQGALQGQGALKGSLDKPKVPSAANAVKQTSATGDKAVQSAESTAAASKSAAGDATSTATSSVNATASAATSKASSATNVAANSATQASSQVSQSKPTVDSSIAAAAGKGSLGANGMGALDAQHSNGATSVDVAGTASASASRNSQ